MYDNLGIYFERSKILNVVSRFLLLLLYILLLLFDVVAKVYFKI